ncbi:MAG: Crp/Fnr family transcriptional regulator [Rhizobium sp.]|nr:Crp/Fnr family transcriptional regulator [Rhizobium sp.]
MNMSAARHSVDEAAVPARCRTCTSRQHGFCSDLTVGELHRLSPHVSRRRADAASQVLSQGLANTSYVHLLDGVVKLTALVRDGTEQIVGLRFAGDFLGQRFARDVGFTAAAATDVEYCRVSKPALDALADQSTRIAHRMHRWVATELDETRGLMLALAQRDARQKVAGLLYRISQRQSPAALRTTLDLPLSRSEMGNYLGITVETVSRQLSRLKREGLISIERKTLVTIEDMGRLAAAANISGQ